MGETVKNGIFVGYGQNAGGGWDDKLRIFNADKLDTASQVNHVRYTEILAGQVIVVKDKDHLGKKVSTSLLPTGKENNQD